MLWLWLWLWFWFWFWGLCFGLANIFISKMVSTVNKKPLLYCHNLAGMKCLSMLFLFLLSVQNAADAQTHLILNDLRAKFLCCYRYFCLSKKLN